MGFQNIGPNYWKGEEGRLALINGTAKFTDQPYIDTWAELAKWAPFMPSGFEAVKYPDSQSLFTSGKAAIYPTGSWEISHVREGCYLPDGVSSSRQWTKPVTSATSATIPISPWV